MKPNILFLLSIIFFFSCSGAEEAFRIANNLNSLEEYEKFLEEYPNSDYSIEVKNIVSSLKEKTAWENAKSENSIDKYEEFLIIFPNSELKEIVKEKINEIKIEQFWNISKSQNTIESYKNFLNQYPNSKYSETAKLNIAKLAEEITWNSALKINSIESYNNFLMNFPNSSYLEIAKSKIEEITVIRPIWEIVLKKNQIEKYRSFLEKYPNSSFAQLAKTKLLEIEDFEWINCKNRNTITAYKKFIQTFPNSKFNENAEERIIDLEVINIFKSDHGYLPPSTKTASYSDRHYSVINIYNNTKYRLTLRYSGKESIKIVFDAYEKSAIEIENGFYKVAASVNSTMVIPYAGEETIDGGDYSVKYYIAEQNSKPKERDWEYSNYIESFPIKRKIKAKL